MILCTLIEIITFSILFSILVSLYPSSGQAQLVYIDRPGGGCVERGGIIVTEKPLSDFKIKVDADRFLYLVPVPITATVFDTYSLCEKEFPTENIRIRFRRRMRKRELEYIANKIREQKFFLKNIYRGEIKPKMWEGDFVFPIKNYKRVKDNFGARRLINGVAGPIHRGIDISARSGEEVYASNSGIVAVARRFILEGNLVVINHGVGIYTIYAHLKKIAVAEGDFVRKGQLIGYVGSTGRSTGSHLHFGAKIGEVDVNPYALFELQDRLSSAIPYFISTEEDSLSLETDEETMDQDD